MPARAAVVDKHNSVSYSSSFWRHKSLDRECKNSRIKFDYYLQQFTNLRVFKAMGSRKFVIVLATFFAIFWGIILLKKHSISLTHFLFKTGITYQPAVSIPLEIEMRAGHIHIEEKHIFIETDQEVSELLECLEISKNLVVFRYQNYILYANIALCIITYKPVHCRESSGGKYQNMCRDVYVFTRFVKQ